MSAKERSEDATESLAHPAPDGLSDRAETFWRGVLATFELSEAERELLREAAWTITEIDDLRGALGVDGLIVAGSTGQRRVHPAVGEIRQHRLALARLVKALELPIEEPETDTAKRARHAAEARWALERHRQTNG